MKIIQSFAFLLFAAHVSAFEFDLSPYCLKIEYFGGPKLAEAVSTCLDQLTNGWQNQQSFSLDIIIENFLVCFTEKIGWGDKNGVVNSKETIIQQTIPVVVDELQSAAKDDMESCWTGPVQILEFGNCWYPKLEKRCKEFRKNNGK